MLTYIRWSRLLPKSLDYLQSVSSVTTSSLRLATLDCLIPGSPETKAIARMVFHSLVLPLALFLWAFVSVLLMWSLGRFSLTTRRWVSDPELMRRPRLVRCAAHFINAVVLAVAKFSESTPELPNLKKYLTKRLVISCIVLAYTFYEPFTSTMLLILQCQRVGGPQSKIEVDYNTTHTSWLQNSSQPGGSGQNTVLALWGKPAPVWEDGLYW